MTTRLWTSSDGNWNAAGSWTPAAIPVSNDKVIFNGDNDVAVTSGHTAQTAVDLDLLFIGDDFTKDIGSSASRLIISSDSVIHRGKGSLFMRSGNVETNEVIVSHTGNQQAISLDYIGSMPLRVIVSRGRVLLVVDAAGDIDDLVISHVTSRANDSDVTYQGQVGSTDSIVNLMLSGGKFRTKTSEETLISNVFICSGKATITLKDGVPLLGKTHISCGGTLEWYTNTGALTESNVYDGLLDFTQNKVEKVATLVNLWPDGRFSFFPDLTTRTIKEWDGKTVDLG